MNFCFFASRVLLVILHDFPELLCEYHYVIIDTIPPNCVQLRNLVLSAYPRNMRLPDPFALNFKVSSPYVFLFVSIFFYQLFFSTSSVHIFLPQNAASISASGQYPRNGDRAKIQSKHGVDNPRFHSTTLGRLLENKISGRLFVGVAWNAAGLFMIIRPCFEPSLRSPEIDKFQISENPGSKYNSTVMNAMVLYVGMK